MATQGVVEHDQPKKVESSLSARCAVCKETIFVEEVVEKDWDAESKSFQTKRRVVQGSYWQKVNDEGMPEGPMMPFCPIHSQEV